MMQTATQSAFTPLPSAHEAARYHRAEEVVYKAVTVSAILLVLGSLWIF